MQETEGADKGFNECVSHLLNSLASAHSLCRMKQQTSTETVTGNTETAASDTETQRD